MFTKLYFPSFFTAPYEKNISKKLSSSDTLGWDRDKFKALLRLKSHASKITSSLSELKGLMQPSQIDSFYQYLSFVMEKAISEKSFNPALYRNELNNRFLLLKDEVGESKKVDKFFSGCNIFTNSIVATTGVLGVALFGAAVFTGPLGMALLAVGMTILSALIATIAAYSIYVDARFLGDKQLREIEDGVTYLSNYYPEDLRFAPEVEEDASWLSCM
ncbi:hypothetical protein OQJ18_05390 [Fluoribacter dumoffii]|uniref:Uncharacterized protein n=1 Tax=Fluoribacter dumoffii TaxID=463 RepID=A0A377G8V2_9GAMM|nr:hypothetical protein [Fluoribacter dumoffii]KTC90129.1 hypothetical protein Ldum_1197 [Fluoribacter dumoffii NY 23]MCW8385426.1 hypothetical protein [Fluoribacter dumoffii]MCW8418479.1 hypothetical protein [Fluoribacter dumoffii]MCW8453679.1 hypothetical protein [Fluoribacter dumoffii]MCW8459103.1 hypothetical protein [Fluoribacter dumoffii]